MFYGLLFKYFVLCSMDYCLSILCYVLWTIDLSFSYLMLSCLFFLPIMVYIDNKWDNFDFFLIFSRFGSVIHTAASFLILSI